MNGTYGGIQKLTRDLWPNAVYVHFAAHNLNLVVTVAVTAVIERQTFFESVQQIYNFFGRSIKRQKVLASFISNKDGESSTSVALNTLNPTRRVGRFDAIFALKVRFFEVHKALTKTVLLNSKADERAVRSYFNKEEYRKLQL